MAKKKPHIVALPVDAKGHITPMMHLCEFLAREGGFRITFVLQPAFSTALDLIRSKGTWPPSDLDINLRALETGTPFRSKTGNEGLEKLTEKLEYLMTFQGKFEELLTELGDVRCVVVDYEIGWNIDIAVKLGITGALLFTGCAAWSWIELEMPNLVSSCESMSLQDDSDSLIHDNPPIRRSDVPWDFWNYKPYQELNITKCHPAIFKASWVLGASCQELEGEIVEAVRAEVGNKFIPIGPLFLLSSDAAAVGYEISNNECLSWLDKQPQSSVLYIAFGSLVSLEVKQFKEFAMGVENSEQRFLWVIRAGDPNESFVRGWYGRNTERGMIVQWSPQTKVLSHPSVGAFLTHCGWNSTAEGISNGQPMLCWPSLFDQKTNAGLIERYWKIGMSFMKGGNSLVASAEVERVIRMIMIEEPGKEMRERAKKLSKMMRIAVSPRGSSLANLELFMNEVKK